MPKTLILFILLAVVLTSCKSAKHTKVVTKKDQEKNNTTNGKKNTATVSYSLAETIINNAKKYKGVRYKYGGTTKKGMDCSGLIYTAFNEENIKIPRTSEQMSTHGNWIDLKTVKKGDLLFFATKKNSRKVNHVGLVVNTNPVEFIHSSSSKGVIISSLTERYWYFAFVQARKFL